MAERDLNFEGVLAGKSAEKRTALIVFPVALLVALAIGFGAVALSRVSSLRSEVTTANKELQEASKAVDERDQKLRALRAEDAILASPGQGGGVLVPIAAGSGANGVVLVHPEEHALAVYAYNLPQAPTDQEYRLIVSSPQGQEHDVGPLPPSPRGGAYALVHDVPEDVVRIEVALLPKGGASAANGPAGPAQAEPGRAVTRQPVMAAALPKAGEEGIVTGPPPPARRAQARAPARRGGRR